MSLKLIKIRPGLLTPAIVAAAIFLIVFAWLTAKWNFANAIAGNLDSRRPESMLVADWLTGVAPNDPQTHYAAGLILERTFNAGDLGRSVNEYGLAAKLAPNNYVMWLKYGQALTQAGDVEGSNSALARALELAPNNSAVQWVYGNSLVRQGSESEGFALIAKAAAGDNSYSKSAAAVALQTFDGDALAAKRVLGDSPETAVALSYALTGAKRFDDAANVWASVPKNDNDSRFARDRDALVGQMITAGQYRAAQKVAGVGQVGVVSNGGFDDGVRASAGVFEWQISDGAEPQIGLGEAQVHGGKYALVLTFNSFQTSQFRSVSQVVAVEPGAEYELKLFYRSDVKTAAMLKWQVASASALTPIADSPVLAPAGDWTALNIKFRVPSDIDGVVIRFNREGCLGPACPMNGRLSFDDVSLTKL